MIHTVLGEIESESLGVTLMHEHIMYSSAGADLVKSIDYDREQIVKHMLPYLQMLKKSGCNTLVDSTPPEEGRDALLLQQCASKTGLNIITNIGTFHGDKVFKEIREGSIDEITSYWIEEYHTGIDCTGVKPGFIKIALNDFGDLTSLQEKILRAAARASLVTGLTIQCHIKLTKSVLQAAHILIEEKLPFHKFIWAHADYESDVSTITDLARKGMWIEIDQIGRVPYIKPIQLLKRCINVDILDRVLISQDAGCYHVEEQWGGSIVPFHRLFTEFIPLCEQYGIKRSVFTKLLQENPAACLEIE
ncbi:hypothetical protein [Chengkuizengella axinellae]|uniref:Phosphotriesterase n=1 Tax=Chengkuizengella axinellae TaxID=3064388 RepID=A0ABT9J2M7_9BACL|nr:hypothetical protein [Chengkuizengella sp. 2205SS18-9]MDP5275861.1 hypothetical protein [Chengkuizengella sp. 2205SS18-9]